MTQSFSLTYSNIDPALFWKASKAACKVKSDTPMRDRIALAVGWLAIFGATLWALQIGVFRTESPAFLLGVGCVVIASLVIAWLNRGKLNRVLASQEKRRGEVVAEISPLGLCFRSSFGATELNWTAIDSILDLGTGTGLRSGLLVYPLPNDILPPEITPQAFREILEGWRVAGGGQSLS